MTATSVPAYGAAGARASAVPFGAAAAPPSFYVEPPPALLAGFALYIVVWFLELGQRIPFFGTIRLEFLLGAVLSAGAITVIRSRSEANRSRLTKYICLYFGFLTCHLAISQYFGHSWDAFIDWILKFSCMALFTYAFVTSPRSLRVFMAMLILVFLKIGSEAFQGQVTGSMVWENQGIMRLHGPPGTRFGHPNSLSGYGVCMLPFIYYLFPVVRWRSRLVLLVALVFAFNMIIFTGSRTGYLAVLALVLFLWLRSMVKARFLVVCALIAVVGLPMVPPQYESRFMSAFVGQEAEGHSKEERIELVNDAMQLIQENPQGLGIYAFRFAREAQLGKTSMDPHNMYLQVFVDLGYVGALVFALFLIALWMELRATTRRLTATESRLRGEVQRTKKADRALLAHLADVRFMNAAASAFLAYLFTRLVLAVFGHDLYEIYWWLTAGASIAIANLEPKVDVRTQGLLAEPVPARPAVPVPAWSRP